MPLAAVFESNTFYTEVAPDCLDKISPLVRRVVQAPVGSMVNWRGITTRERRNHGSCFGGFNAH
jgi:hypothetical protein